MRGRPPTPGQLSNEAIDVILLEIQAAELGAIVDTDDPERFRVRARERMKVLGLFYNYKIPSDPLGTVYVIKEGAA